MEKIIFLILLSGLFTFNVIFFKKISHPSVIFSLVWFFVIILEYCCEIFKWLDLIPLSIEANLVFFFGIVFFTLGCIFFKSKEISDNYFYPKIKINTYFSLLLFLIPIVCFPFYFQKLSEIAVTNDSRFFLANLRWSLQNEDGYTKLGVFNYLSTIAIFNYSIRINDDNKLLKISSLIIALIYALFSTGRTFFLLVLLIYLGNQLLKKKIQFQKIAVYVIAFTLLFIAISISQEKSNIAVDDSTSEILKVAGSEVLLYITPSLNAYDYMLKHTIEYANINNNTLIILRFFYAFGYKVGLIDTRVNELTQPFVYVNEETNVYTIYQPFTIDFGIFANFPFLFLLGLFYSFIFQKAKKKKLWAFQIYTYSLYPLIMSFFQEQYFNLLSTWLQFIILHIIYYFFIKKTTWNSPNDSIKYSNSKLELK